MRTPFCDCLLCGICCLLWMPYVCLSVWVWLWRLVLWLNLGFAFGFFDCMWPAARVSNWVPFRLETTVSTFARQINPRTQHTHPYVRNQNPHESLFSSPTQRTQYVAAARAEQQHETCHPFQLHLNHHLAANTVSRLLPYCSKATVVSSFVLPYRNVVQFVLIPTNGMNNITSHTTPSQQ
jgi:hypothetical protein